MAAKKKGTAIGRQDINGTEVFIGDFVKSTSTGRAYSVNKYGNLVNPFIGSAKFSSVGDFVIIDENTYKGLIMLEEQKHQTTEDEPLDLVIPDLPQAPEQEAQWNEDAESAPEMPCEAKDEQEEKSTDSPSADCLSHFSNDELLDELRKRGYSGDITRTYMVTEKVAL